MKPFMQFLVVLLILMACTQSRPIDFESLSNGLKIYYGDAGVDTWYSIDDVKILRRKNFENGFELIEIEYKLNFKQSSEQYLSTHNNVNVREFVTDKDLQNVSAGETLTIREVFKIKEFKNSYTMETASVADSF